MIRQSQAADPAPIVLLTRPLMQSQRFAGELALRYGAVQVVISPLMAPRVLPQPHSPAAAAVIFTSETGVAAAAESGLWQTGRPDIAYCVGTRTAGAAAAQGFSTRDAGGDWRDLAALIAADGAKSPLIFACARDAPHHLQTALKALGFTVLRCDVYAQDPQPLTAQARAVLAGANPVLLPLFSPRSAAQFCAVSLHPNAPLRVAALSENVAKAFSLPVQSLRVADRPNAAAMLDCIGGLLQIPPLA